MKIMTYDQILKLEEYKGIKITEQIRQEAIKQTEMLDLISYAEGLDIVLDDMELLENKEATELNQKAKKVQKELTRGERKKEDKPRKRTVKVDPLKDNIVNNILEYCTNTNIFVNPQLLKSNLISFKDQDGKYYSIKITKHKTKPEGYQD